MFPECNSRNFLKGRKELQKDLRSGVSCLGDSGGESVRLEIRGSTAGSPCVTAVEPGVGAVTDRPGVCECGLSGVLGDSLGTSSNLGNFWSFECREGDVSPARVDSSSSRLRKLVVLEPGGPKANGDIVLCRGSKRGGDGAASEI